MDDSSSPPPKQSQNYRSTASSNWRMKDEAPRAESGQPRGGRYSRPGQHSQSASQPADDGPSTRLYVGNLLYTAQKSDIEQLFTSNGFTVVNVSISTDPFTGRNPSYCFVDVDSADEAQRAIAELNGMDVLGRGVRVSPGVARKAGAGGANGTGSREVRTKNFAGGWGGNARESREEKTTEYKPSFDRWNRSDASSHFTAPQSEGRRLYVGNLPRIEPQSALDEEIQSLFSAYLGDSITPSAVSKLISPHPSKATEPGNHYYCFVDLENAGDVETVIAALDGKELSGGGALRVNKAREQRGDRERKVVREQGLGNRGGSGWRGQE